MSKRKLYEDYLRQKRVCLVGPAPSLLEIKPEQGHLIDNYDIVVRINRSLPLSPNLSHFLGTKTNVLYNCLNTDPEAGGFINIPYLEEEIEWLVCPYPSKPPFERDIEKFERQNNERINFTTFNLEKYKSLEKEMNTRPNSGVLAILDILSCEIEELYITGITFFKGGYIKEYRKYDEQQVLARMAAHGNHKQEPQIEYMKKILSSDNRVKMDKFLREIINE